LQATGGVNEVVKSLIRGMQSAQDLKPLVLVSNGSSRIADWDARQSFETVYMELREPELPESAIRGYLGYLAKLPSRLWQLRKLVRQHDVGIVNLHYPNLNGLTFLILRAIGWFRGPIILSFHLGDARRAVKTSGLTRLLWKVLLRQSDAMISPSKELLNDLRAIDGKSESRFGVINNGVNFELFSQRPETLHGFPPELVGRPVVISVGNFEERKGHQTLLRAFPKVLERFPDAALVMIGAKFPFVEELRRIIAELGLERQAFLFENLPHDTLPAYLSRASIFALATASETFPLAILEAAAAGLPVVSTWAPGVPELVTDTVTGRLVNIGDADAFAANIIDLLEKPEEARRLAENLHNQVRDNFTWAHHYARYSQMYRRLMR
jgi:glycosyltransferase involved in cell wall biosynthesis